MAKGKVALTGRGTGWADKTVEWPDVKVHRTIVFRNPFKATTAKTATTSGA
jgi:hypothetical protein